MIFLRFWTVAAIVTTGFGHPSPKPPSPKDPSLESPSSQTQDVLGILGLEEFMQKDPGTAVLLLISVGGVSAVATQYLWKGVQEGFGLSRAFRPGRNRCDASEPAKKNDYPDDALVVTPTELANPFSDSDINTLPVRPDLTLQQEALRQGFFQGMKSGGKTRNDLEIWQTLEGFEAGYKEKRKDKLDLDRLRSFKNGITTWKDSAVREAWWRGYEAGFQRAEQAEKSAEKLQANIQKAHHAGVAVGVCVREARYRWLECVPDVDPPVSPKRESTPQQYEAWIDQCMSMVRERKLDELLEQLKASPPPGQLTSRVFFPFQNKVDSVKKGVVNSVNALANVKMDPAKFAPAAGAFLSSAAKNIQQPQIAKPVLRGG